MATSCTSSFAGCGMLLINALILSLVNGAARLVVAEIPRQMQPSMASLLQPLPDGSPTPEEKAALDAEAKGGNIESMPAETKQEESGIEPTAQKKASEKDDPPREVHLTPTEDIKIPQLNSDVEDSTLQQSLNDMYRDYARGTNTVMAIEKQKERKSQHKKAAIATLTDAVRGLAPLLQNAEHSASNAVNAAEVLHRDGMHVVHETNKNSKSDFDDIKWRLERGHKDVFDAVSADHLFAGQAHSTGHLRGKQPEAEGDPKTETAQKEGEPEKAEKQE